MKKHSTWPIVTCENGMGDFQLIQKVAHLEPARSTADYYDGVAARGWTIFSLSHRGSQSTYSSGSAQLPTFNRP